MRLLAGSSVGAEKSGEGGAEHFLNFLMPVLPADLVHRLGGGKNAHQKAEAPSNPPAGIIRVDQSRAF